MSDNEQRLVELRDKLDTLTTRLSDVRSLEGSPGWRLVKEVMEGQLRARRIESFQTELRSIDGVLQAVGSQGHMAALQLWLNAPKLLIDDLEADLASVRTEIDDLTGKDENNG